MLRVVAREVATGASPFQFEERVAEQFQVTTRCVRDYIKVVLEDVRDQDRAILARARLQGRFVAGAASAKWIKRSDELWREAARILARVRAIDLDRKGEIDGATSRLIKHLESSGRASLDDGFLLEEMAVPLDQLRGGAVVETLRRDRRDAAILIKRAEGCDARALEWFERAQKIAGTYEPAPPDTEAAKASLQLTSVQRRARLDSLRAHLASIRKEDAAEANAAKLADKADREEL